MHVLFTQHFQRTFQVVDGLILKGISDIVISVLSLNWKKFHFLNLNTPKSLSKLSAVTEILQLRIYTLLLSAKIGEENSIGLVLKIGSLLLFLLVLKSSDTHSKFHSILSESGEIGGLILNYDWSSTSIGEIDTWPLSLKNTLSNILRSSFPMFLFWGDDLICFYNDAYRPSLGTNGKHPAIGKKADIVWPEIWDFLGTKIKEVTASGQPFWFENQLVPIFRNGDIEEVYWTFSYSPAHGDDSTICGVIVTCMETTQAVLNHNKIVDTVTKRTEELQKAQDLLTLANDYLQNIINISLEPLQVLEPVFENGDIVDFRFKLTNHAYAAYAKTTPEELKDKKVSEFFPGYFNTSSFKNNVEVFKSGKANTWNIHYNQDGLNLYNRMSSTKVGNEVIVHFTDFTEVKHLQQELEKKIIELERSNTHLQDFAYAASHDLKEPIRKIQFFIKFVRDQLTDRLNENELQIFNRIENATQRMELLINDLLVYSQVSYISHEEETVDLNEIIKQVVVDLDLAIQQKNVSLKIETLPTLKGYSRQLQQLFQNLISNSIKYSQIEKQPEVAITSSIIKQGDLNYYHIKITDNGIGFEQQYAEKIFQMFARLHGKSEYSGSGVGLAIVKKVIDNHKGIITAESTPKMGSTFNILLPADI